MTQLLNLSTEQKGGITQARDGMRAHFEQFQQRSHAINTLLSYDDGDNTFVALLLKQQEEEMQATLTKLDAFIDKMGRGVATLEDVEDLKNKTIHQLLQEIRQRFSSYIGPKMLQVAHDNPNALTKQGWKLDIKEALFNIDRHG